MKKRLIPLLPALAVCAGLLGSPAYADGADFTIEGGVLTKYNAPAGMEPSQTA